MIVETGDDRRFKRSLFYDLQEQSQPVLAGLADRSMKVGSWHAFGGLVQVECTTKLDQIAAWLHINTYVLKYGLNFELVVTCCCKHEKSGNQFVHKWFWNPACPSTRATKQWTSWSS